MLIALGIAAAVVALVALLLAGCWFVIDRDQPVLGCTLAGTALFLAVFASICSVDEPGPCLRYKQGSAYNSATKTMMPYRSCVQRGEWLEDAA